MHGDYYINVVQPDSVLRHLRARSEHSRRLWRAGVARPCRSVRHRRLRHRLHVAGGLRPHRRHSHRAHRRHGRDGGLCRSVAARDRHRLHHDHAGARRNHLGPRLSLDQHHRRRQRHQRARTAASVRLRDRLARRLLLHDAGGVPGGVRRGGGVRALADGRRADGHARPAAPHERARLSRLGDPLLGLHVLRPAHRDRRHPVRLLHPVHQPAGARPDRLGRGAADGDLRRRRHAARARSSAPRWWWW